MLPRPLQASSGRTATHAGVSKHGPTSLVKQSADDFLGRQESKNFDTLARRELENLSDIRLVKEERTECGDGCRPLRKQAHAQRQLRSSAQESLSEQATACAAPGQPSKFAQKALHQVHLLHFWPH